MDVLGWIIIVAMILGAIAIDLWEDIIRVQEIEEITEEHRKRGDTVIWIYRL